MSSSEAPKFSGCKTPQELWKLVDADKNKAWYTASVQYWDQQKASYDGVLGGYGAVSGSDIAESEKFLQKACRKLLATSGRGKPTLIAVDCGAGVGRVTEQLLAKYCGCVDLVEPSQHLLETARRNLPSSLYFAGRTATVCSLGTTYCLGLQDFRPQEDRYDIIWVQWALLYITDDDAVAFLARCGQALRCQSEGAIFVKENVCGEQEQFIVDEEDKSLTRCHSYMLKLFSLAGLQLVCSAQQREFPKELFRVQMYALRPSSSKT